MTTLEDILLEDRPAETQMLLTWEDILLEAFPATLAATRVDLLVVSSQNCQVESSRENLLAADSAESRLIEGCLWITKRIRKRIMLDTC